MAAIEMLKKQKCETTRGSRDFIPRSLREHAEQCLAIPYAYMDSEVFAQRNIEQQLFSYEQEPELPLTAWYRPTRDEVLDGAAVATPQLMSAQEEKLTFLRFNFAKRKLLKLQGRVRKAGLTRASAEELVEWHRRYEHFREYLVRTNLALVLAMAKRMRLGEADYAEIVSEGNMALIRAVEKFDVERGFKFSTYACRSIIKAISRTLKKSMRHRSRFSVEFEPQFEKSNWSDSRREQIEADCIDELKAIVDRNLADLSNVEQAVIRYRFNWQEAEEAPLTLEEVGKMIGLTKERVRQIQNKAFQKIKMRMQETVFRTRTGLDHSHVAV